MAGIYIHIPFCKQACYYCDFHFSTNHAVKPEMVKALGKELELQKNYLGKETVETIYLGGGTPSLLENDDLTFLVNVIRNNFSVASHAEISLEANPDDLYPEKLQQLYTAGINRLSIGIQSFDNELLKFLNRAHNRDAAIACVHHAREAGFNNLSLDLIYAIPGETEATWITDIHQAIALTPDHISCYSLTIEEKTVFGRWTAAGKLNPANDETAAHHLELLMQKLTAAGYDHYEISNFARPGFESKHNSSYWRQKSYLGIGPSAHSYNGLTRQYNVRNNHQYIRSIEEGKIPFEIELLSRENRINEYILTTLRTHWGTNLNVLRNEFNYDLVKENSQYLSALQERALVFIERDVLKLTMSGKLLADKISSDLFLTTP